MFSRDEGVYARVNVFSWGEEVFSRGEMSVFKR